MNYRVFPSSSITIDIFPAKMSVCSFTRRISAIKSLRRCSHDHNSRLRSKEFLGLNSQFGYLANAASSDGDGCLKERQDRIRVETRLVSTQMVPEINLHLITPDMEVWQDFSWPNRGPGHIFSEGNV